MLTLQNVTKKFRVKNEKVGSYEYVGVEDISFSAQPGEVFSLIGANGAGKTTTMRMIADLITPENGSISLEGKSYSQIPDLKKLVSFVSSETQNYDRLTARETITLFAEMGGLSKKEIQDKINELDDYLDMGEILDKTVGSFSTGMKQKVSIARALATNPRVIIFDEVTNGLDIFAAQGVKELIKKLRDDGRIILFSTHIMSDADELSDKVALIHDGRILAQGEVKELLKQYKVANLHSLFFKLVDPSYE